MDKYCRLITTSSFLVIHFYDYGQSNAPSSTYITSISNSEPSFEMSYIYFEREKIEDTSSLGCHE